MKVLFTQHTLVRRGGSELFVVEAATAMRRSGHKVAVYAGEIGETAGMLAASGIPVLDDPRLCPWTPDIIHGQHGLHAVQALAAFPRTPSVLHIHGFLPEQEKPFVHPRILRYLVISLGAVDFWSVRLGVDRGRFEFLPNSVDTTRFAAVRRPPARPRTALAYTNRGFDPRDWSEIERGCAACGVSLQTAGLWTGRTESEPEQLLPKFDLVFAVGRSALEAVASGCGVIPLAGDMAEELVAPSNYDRLRGQNMAPAFFRHEKLSADWIQRQILSWNPGSIAAVTSKVRKDCGQEQSMRRIASIHAAVVNENSVAGLTPWKAEFEAVNSLLNPGESRHIHELEAKNRSMESSWSWRLTRPLRIIDERVRQWTAGMTS